MMGLRGWSFGYDIMTDEYLPQTDSVERKKLLLVPLLVLLICTVALVGCAYAYATEVQIGNNTVDPDYYTIDYVNSSGDSIAVPIEVDGDTLALYSHLTVDADADDSLATKTLVVTTDSTQKVKMSFYVKVDTDSAKTFTIDVTTDVADVDVLSDLLTMDAFTPISNVAGGTVQKIDVWFSVKNVADLDAIVTTDIETLEDIPDAVAEISGKAITFTVTATPSA